MNTPMPSSVATGTASALATRQRWEAEKIARAQAEVDAGFGIAGPDLDRFLNDLEHSDQPVKVPPAKRLPLRA